MSKSDTPFTTLQRIIKNTNTKTILNKTKVIENNEYNNLILYISNNITNNKVLTIKEQLYNTKYEQRTKTSYYITDNNGRILNVSHILYLIYKPYLPYIKLNTKHNYILGNLTTSSEIYARISNYIYRKNKIQINIQYYNPFTE